MSLVFIRVAIAGFKLAARPLNSMLKRAIKARKDFQNLNMLQQMVIGCGQTAHRFEHWLNHTIIKLDAQNIKPDSDGPIRPQLKPLKQEAAFNKGADYISELLFFYGSLAALAIWDLRRNINESNEKAKQKKILNENIEDAKK